MSKASSPITVRLPDATVEALDALALKEDETRNAVMQRLIEDGLAGKSLGKGYDARGKEGRRAVMELKRMIFETTEKWVKKG